MTLQETQALAILEGALRSEFGLIVRAELIADGTSLASPAAKAKQVLYRFRTDYADYRDLQIRLSPTDPANELWIINRRGAMAVPPPTDEAGTEAISEITLESL